MKYDFTEIEHRWQSYWDEHKVFATPGPGDANFDPSKPKYYVLDFFPYPSGVGLHVGHPLGYIATDILARYKRMRGFNVLHPMGFDAFGLPAEQYAVEHGIHPKVTTERNIKNMVRQLKRLGMSYDWDRCLSTTDTEYYKWTQWIFLQLYHAWFDPAAGKARPIAELIGELESGNLYVGPEGGLVPALTHGIESVAGEPIGTHKWHELSPQEQYEVLDKYRLAYMAEVPVNWCPTLGTVLANEEVTSDGLSERGNHPVHKRPLRQWMLRITAYADRLMDDLDRVDWPEPIKLMQRNWIGRSEGALVHFRLANESSETEEVLSVFTTRPDTVFGATYMVLSPEHPLVELITVPSQRGAVQDYKKLAASRSEIDRLAEAGTKTGEFTGAFAVNPVNDEKIPIWIADYVLMGYGTGAIMAVPAHDQRDHDFARKFDLEIRQVISFGDELVDIRNQAWPGDGLAMNSANEEVTLDGLQTENAKKVITQWLESRGFGAARVQYKLRDWLFSRQRYWGEPFPVLHGPDGEIVALDASELPVELPAMRDFTPRVSGLQDPTIETPLSRAADSWKYVQRDGRQYSRELNTMPQWAGSCWYYLRFLDPKNSAYFVSPEAERYWMGAGPKSQSSKSGHQEEKGGHDGCGGVDLYVGGAEHAVLHLLYARFWHKVLYDLGHVSTPEPFGKLFNQGYIQAYAYRDSRGIYVPADEVKEQDGKILYQGQSVEREFGKMGKALKNAVAPDEVCEQYGCDTLRLYEMYMGPLDQSRVWQPRDIVGVHRFLQRLWRNFVNEDTGQHLVEDSAPSDDLQRFLHGTIKRVGQAMESMSFNVAIAALIELNNLLVGLERIPREVAEKLLICLAPVAPHLCEDLWAKIGNQSPIANVDWPHFDEALLVEDQIEYPVQVNGKLRSRITVSADTDDAAIEAAAMQDAKVKVGLEGKSVKKVILIKGRLINLVAN